MNFTYDEICKMIGSIILEKEAKLKELVKYNQDLQEQFVQLKQQQFKDGQSTSTENDQ